ncbi:TPA: Gfo/Idh/MocA family oxidoreductase, partial [Legionella pneumophila]
DMARFLMQSEVVEVYATGAVLINPDFEQFDDVDTAIIQLRFANGAFGVIDNSRQAIYGYDQRVEVFGSGGMLLAENQLEHTVSRYSANATDSAKPQYFFLERYHQAYLAELNAFYSAWNDNQTSPVSGLDGLQALRIAKAAKQSLETRLPVVLN